MHSNDPDSVPLGSPAALAYDAEARTRGADSPPDCTLRYGPDRAHFIDLWRGPRPGSPILVFWHGGAWIAGHPGWVWMMAAAARAHGFALAAPAYRLAPRCRWPAQLDDALAAGEFVAAHAAKIDGDPSRLLLAGHSAGGHLAAHAALRGSLTPRACLAVSAPLDLRYGDVPADSPAARTYRYLLVAREDNTEASPIVHAAPRSPFHLTWGERDFDHTRESNPRFAAAIRASGGEAAEDIRPGLQHFDTHLALANPADPWWAAARAFA